MRKAYNKNFKSKKKKKKKKKKLLEETSRSETVLSSESHQNFMHYTFKLVKGI